LRIRSEFEKSVVKSVSKLSTNRPHRVKRLSDEFNLFRRHDGNHRSCACRRPAARAATTAPRP
jgi:hypothetical protein